MNSKNKTRLGLIFTVLFIILFVFVISIRQMEYGYIRDKKVRKDAYVYESNPDTNYGNNNFIRVGNLNSGRAEAYYCFDISSLPNGWTEAIIVVNFDFASSLVDVGVNLTYERWDETAITWNNKPDHKSYRGHILNDGFSFNIPLKPANFTNDEITICLYGKGGATDGYIQGPSREGASDEHEAPFIRLTYPQIDPIVLTAITVGSILIFCVVILGLYLETRNREMKINQYITIRLEHGRTYIYVNGKKFIQCIQLVLNIPRDDIRFYEDIDSIDEAVKLNRVFTKQHNMIGGHFGVRRKNYRYKITAKQEFWGHCSNIQAWVENNYDTRILMSNISFRLLRELVKAGDPVARKVLKEEITLRLESGHPSVIQYLLNQGYIGYSNTSEFKEVDLEILLKNLKKSREIISEDPNELEKIDTKIEANEILLEKMKERIELRTVARYHYKFMFFVLLLGDSSTGIEELTSSYLYGDHTNYKFTLGAQFFSRMSNFQNDNVKLLFWDVAVEERFRFLFLSFFRNKQGAIIMYDITNAETLSRIPEWVQLIRESSGNIPVMLVGNSVDLAEFREVSREDVRKIVEEYNLTTFIEISTKTGENVEEVFTKLTKFIMEHIQENFIGEIND